MNTRTMLRWLFLIPLVIAVWYLVFIEGMFTYQSIERHLCPKQDLVSGFCHNNFIIKILEVIKYIFVGLSAVLVLFTSALVAPSFKNYVATITFLLGSLIAIFIGYSNAWSLVIMAIVSVFFSLVIYVTHVLKKV